MHTSSQYHRQQVLTQVRCDELLAAQEESCSASILHAPPRLLLINQPSLCCICSISSTDVKGDRQQSTNHAAQASPKAFKEVLNLLRQLDTFAEDRSHSFSSWILYGSVYLLIDKTRGLIRGAKRIQVHPPRLSNGSHAEPAFQSCFGASQDGSSSIAKACSD
jgi:hypothetical protein